MALAMVTITSGCLGANRIFLAMCPLRLLLGERNGGGHDRDLADDPRGVALAGRVLDQPRVAGAEHVLGAVAEPDLELPLQDDHELPPRRGVPVEEAAHRPHAERDLRGRQPLEPVGFLVDVDRLDAPLPVGAGVEPERSHGVLPVARDASIRGRWPTRDRGRPPTPSTPSGCACTTWTGAIRPSRRCCSFTAAATIAATGTGRRRRCGMTGTSSRPTAADTATARGPPQRTPRRPATARRAPAAP